MTTISRHAVLAALALAGCYDSLVSGECADGYAMSDGTCRVDLGPDAGRPDAGQHDAGPMADALACTLPEVACLDGCTDVTGDPNNCGACGRTCSSGICQASACVGGLVGHVVAIGHDYRSRDAAMSRVLGNAIALGNGATVSIGYYIGSSDEATWGGVLGAANDGLVAIGRNHTDTFPTKIDDASLARLDTLVIYAQTGDGDAVETLATSWAAPLASFFGRGGVVVVLEGLAGTSYRAAHGAGLYDVLAPIDATSQQVTISNATDAVVQHVPSPYLARSTSVAYPGHGGAVVNAAGDAVVFHVTK